MSKDYALTQAVQAIDLPALVHDLYPASKAIPGKQGLYFASWRGNDDTPAFSVFKHEGKWFWRDQATGDSGNAFYFLTRIAGMDAQEAAHELLRRAGMPVEHKDSQKLGKPVSVEMAEKHRKARPVPIKALRGRGFIARDVSTYGILKDGDDALIPIADHHGVIVAVKRRLATPTKEGKYRWETSGHGTPAWCSPGIDEASIVLVIEGELNAMIAHSVMAEKWEGYATMGVSGAQTSVNAEALRKKRVFIYSDDDKAGRDAKGRWREEAREAGAETVSLLPTNDKDFCDVAGEGGREALRVMLRQMIEGAIVVYGPEDRVVSGFSIKELMSSARNYLDARVLNPMGFDELDRYTGGLPDSGLIGVGALPSMGKSAILRRVLVEHVRKGGRVALLSPDQSAKSVYRLLATMFSGVPLSEIREDNFSNRVINRWGDEEKARQAWMNTYSWIVREFSERFIVSEEHEMVEIKKLIEKYIDRGVTMFGGDYLQMFEAEGVRSDDQGRSASREFKKLARQLDVPFVMAVQLAKYKFPPSRKSGVPLVTDIEGSGAIFQNCEQFFMLYNEHIYLRKYAGPDTESFGDGGDVGRVYVRKNKEGDSDSYFFLNWSGKLVSYRTVGPEEDFSDLWS